MSDRDSPWISSAPEAAGRMLVQMPLPVLEALSREDLESARQLSPHQLTPYLVSDECRGVWKMRVEQIKADPQDAYWVTRLIVSSDGAVVGRAGYHGQPNQDGMVEIGYSIDPLHRRQGHARAAFRILLDMAMNDPRVKVFRASVSPDNDRSRALIDQFGLQVVGEQWDDEDGLEIVLELPADGKPINTEQVDS